MRKLSCLTIVALTAALAQSLAAQVIDGQLLDEQARKPIVAGLIVVIGSDKSAVPVAVLTDSAGRFRVSLPAAASFRIEASRIGYTASTVEAFSIGHGETVRLELSLAVNALPIKPLTVTARSTTRNRILQARGFYDRQKTGRGSFLTREQIAARQAYFVSDLFRTVRGFRVVPNGRGTGSIVASARDTRCLPDVYINGVKTSRVLTPSDDPLNVLRPEHLEGIEAFAGAASIPQEYNPRGTACSVILLWTGER
ncbi:MAG: carboxypeptidase regulatory-like domain-containing protein [Gemmatimonadota bacterium]